MRELKIKGIYKHYDMFLDEVNKNGQKYRFELQDIKSVKD